MNKQEYLNQISAPAPVAKKGLPGFFRSKFFWIIIGALAALVLIMGIGAALSGNKVSPSERVSELILQIDGLNSTIGEYQNSLRSSTLRGYSASLAGSLGSTSANLTAYATEVYKYKEKDVPEEVRGPVDEHLNELNEELFSAKINGNLDEIFDLKMVYEISLVMTAEEALMKLVNNETLQGQLDSSLRSLENLYNDFDEYTVGM